MPSSTSISKERTASSTENVRTLFLAWQDPDERSWFTVGRLDQKNGTYVFRYTQGAEDAKARGFDPIVSFPDLYRTYESDEIFPLFANQVLSRNRPEFDDFVEWLSLPKNEADPIAILARTGDQVTDTLEIFPYPTQRSEDTYVVHFFVRGLRHQSACAIERELAQLSGEQMTNSTVEVVRVNPSPAPVHFRILCRLTMNWTSDRTPFDAPVYQPLNDG